MSKEESTPLPTPGSERSDEYDATVTEECGEIVGDRSEAGREIRRGTLKGNGAGDGVAERGEGEMALEYSGVEVMRLCMEMGRVRCV